MAYLKINGFHTGPTGPKPPFSYYQTLDDAGVPFTLKVTDAAPPLEVLELARNSLVPHTIVYRRSRGIKGGDNVYSVPDYQLPANDAAKKHFDLHFQELPPEVVGYRDIVWIETINETNKDDDSVVEWTAEFSLYHSQYWLDRGFKYLCFGWAGGCPEPHHWRGPKMLELLRFAASKPDKLGIALHEYSLSKDIWNGTSEDGRRWLVGRFEHLHKACDDNDIMRPRIVMTEWGWGKDEILLPEQRQRWMDYLEVGELYSEHANIQGAAIWCLNQGDEWGNVHTKIQSDINQIMGMALNTTYPDPPVWPEENQPMPDKPKIVIVKKPQKAQMTEAENEQANDYAWNNYGRTSTHSDDDMKTMLDNGNDESYAVVCWPDRQPGTVHLLESAGYRWVMFPEEVPPPTQWTKLPIPHMSQLGGGASARSNDCGAAAVAMVVNGMTANRPTVDDVAIKYQNPPNSYMNFSQLDAALNGYGMDGLHRRPYFPEQIHETIRTGKPVIALVWYQSLPQKFSTFNGSHFIVVYGTDGNGSLLYRDPLATSSNEIAITYGQLERAMRDAQNSGNQPNQGMDCVKKNEPPPSGRQVNIRKYFEPTNEYGRKYVLRWPDGKTQPQQLRKLSDGTIALFKGDGQTIDGKFVYDYERFFFDAVGNLRRLEDTSAGGRNAYSQNGAVWLPPVITEGTTYTNVLTVTNYDRISCQKLSDNQTTDYLTFAKYYPTWTSPQNQNIVLQDVCKIEWRKSPGGKVEETYYLAEGIVYGGWDNAAIHEWADGQQNINGKVWNCG